MGRREKALREVKLKMNLFGNLLKRFSNFSVGSGPANNPRQATSSLSAASKHQCKQDGNSIQDASISSSILPQQIRKQWRPNLTKKILPTECVQGPTPNAPHHHRGKV